MKITSIPKKRLKEVEEDLDWDINHFVIENHCNLLTGFMYITVGMVHKLSPDMWYGMKKVTKYESKAA